MMFVRIHQNIANISHLKISISRNILIHGPSCWMGAAPGCPTKRHLRRLTGEVVSCELSWRPADSNKKTVEPRVNGETWTVQKRMVEKVTMWPWPGLQHSCLSLDAQNVVYSRKFQNIISVCWSMGKKRIHLSWCVGCCKKLGILKAWNQHRIYMDICACLVMIKCGKRMGKRRELNPNEQRTNRRTQRLSSGPSFKIAAPLQMLSKKSKLKVQAISQSAGFGVPIRSLLEKIGQTNPPALLTQSSVENSHEDPPLYASSIMEYIWILNIYSYLYNDIVIFIYCTNLISSSVIMICIRIRIIIVCKNIVERTTVVWNFSGLPAESRQTEIQSLGPSLSGACKHVRHVGSRRNPSLVLCPHASV